MFWLALSINWSKIIDFFSGKIIYSIIIYVKKYFRYLIIFWLLINNKYIIYYYYHLNIYYLYSNMIKKYIKYS